MKRQNFKASYGLPIFILTNLILLIGCEKDISYSDSQEIDANGISKNPKKFIVEQAYPDRTGEIVDITIEGQNLKAEKIDSLYVFEGDILFSEEDIREMSKSNGAMAKSTGRTKKHWPNCTVYYTIENSLPNKQRVFDAIDHWEENTKFNFIERTNQSGYINFRKGDGCSSMVGRQGGRQHITLADGCSTGNTIHEIGHAVGLWHEQSRSDRDNYVDIIWNNIQGDMKHNFETYRQRGQDGAEYSPFDFGSIMMYGPFSFSKNGKSTITKNDGTTY